MKQKRALQTGLQPSQRRWERYKRFCKPASAAGNVTNGFANSPAPLGTLQTGLQARQRRWECYKRFCKPASAAGNIANGFASTQNGAGKA